MQENKKGNSNPCRRVQLWNFLHLNQFHIYHIFIFWISTPWGVELWNQFSWHQFHIYPVEFNSMRCWIVKPISLKSNSYLFGFQLWNQFHWNQFHICLDFKSMECWNIELWNQSHWNQFQRYWISSPCKVGMFVKPVSLKSISALLDFKSMECWNVCETNFIEINFISIGFQVHGGFKCATFFMPM